DLPSKLQRGGVLHGDARDLREVVQRRSGLDRLKHHRAHDADDRRPSDAEWPERLDGGRFDRTREPLKLLLGAPAFDRRLLEGPGHLLDRALDRIERSRATRGIAGNPEEKFFSGAQAHLRPGPSRAVGSRRTNPGRRPAPRGDAARPRSGRTRRARNRNPGRPSGQSFPTATRVSSRTGAPSCPGGALPDSSPRKVAPQSGVSEKVASKIALRTGKGRSPTQIEPSSSLCSWRTTRGETTASHTNSSSMAPTASARSRRVGNGRLSMTFPLSASFSCAVISRTRCSAGQVMNPDRTMCTRSGLRHSKIRSVPGTVTETVFGVLNRRLMSAAVDAIGPHTPRSEEKVGESRAGAVSRRLRHKSATV